jgi:hypothetical protein
MQVTRHDQYRTRVNTDRSVSLVNERGIELCRTVAAVVPSNRIFNLGWASGGGGGFEIRVDGRIVPLMDS